MKYDVLELRSGGKKVMYSNEEANSNEGHIERQVTHNALAKIYLSPNVIG